VSVRSLGSFRALWVLMATVFVDMVGFAMVLPLLPYYATRLGASPTVIGMLVATFALAQLLTAPMWGRFSDRHGRKPIILIGLLVAAIAYVIFGLATSLWLLFLCRLVQGASGITAVVQAYVADLVEPEHRAQALGWITAATYSGTMVGPALGSLATHWGPAAPGFIAAALCLVNVASAWRWLAEPTRQRMEEKTRQPGETRRMIVNVLTQPRGDFAMPVWIYTFGMMAFMAMNTVLALFLAQRFGVTEKNIGWFYAYVGAVSVLMRAVLLGPAVRRLGEVGAVSLGAACLAAGLLLVPLSPSILWLGLSVLFIPVGTALLFPATTSLTSRRAPKHRTGQALGVQQSFGGMSRLVGPLWAGALFQVGIAVPFLAGAGLMALVAVWARGLRPTRVAQEVAASEPLG
jgi:multidrug resistance protein